MAGNRNIPNSKHITSILLHSYWIWAIPAFCPWPTHARGLLSELVSCIECFFSTATKFDVLVDRAYEWIPFIFPFWSTWAHGQMTMRNDEAGIGK